MVININGKRVESPDRWEDPLLTTDKYQQIVGWEPDKELADRDYFKLFRILSGTDYKKFENSDHNKAELWDIVKWVIETPFPKSDTVPKIFFYKDQEIIVPREIKFLSPGQNIHARQELDKAIILRTKEGKFVDCNCYSILVAIFLQPLIDKKEFNFQRAKEIEKDIAQMNITKIRPIGFFLLKRVLNFGESSILTWLKTLINPTRNVKRLSLS